MDLLLKQKIWGLNYCFEQIKCWSYFCTFGIFFSSLFALQIKTVLFGAAQQSGLCSGILNNPHKYEKY